MPLLMIVIIIGLLSLFFISKNIKIDNQIKEVTPEEAIELIRNQEYKVIDVREPEEFEAKHIIGSANLPISTLKETFRQIPDDINIIIICRSGNRSLMALSFLKDQGYDNLCNLRGGIMAWNSAGLPLNI